MSDLEELEPSSGALRAALARWCPTCFADEGEWCAARAARDDYLPKMHAARFLPEVPRVPWELPVVRITPEQCADVKTLCPRDTFRCIRKICDHFAQVRGGNCPCCFDRTMNEPYPRPEGVVLCGSTRFFDAFREANLRLTLAGKIVLSIGCDTKSDADLEAIDGQPIEAVKAGLDVLHKRKIDLADRVLVLNVGGYIGDSTRSEIVYAEWYEKPIDYLEPGLAS